MGISSGSQLTTSQFIQADRKNSLKVESHSNRIILEKRITKECYRQGPMRANDACVPKGVQSGPVCDSKNETMKAIKESLGETGMGSVIWLLCKVHARRD